MPDVSCQYTLAYSGGQIDFNDGGADQFYITEIPQGLAGAPVTVPVDPVPFADGSIQYQPWLRGRHITVEGIFLITSTRVMNNILTIRNQMEAALVTALAATDTSNTGAFSFTPLGGSFRQLNVVCDTPLECVHDQGYLVRTFSFGLFAFDPAQ